MSRNIIKIETSAEIHAPVHHVWKGITNAVMSYPKPFCFNLGVPLPIKCEITKYENNIGKNRRCTSDHGSIEQEISCYERNSRLSFRMRSNDLKMRLVICEMNDDFVLNRISVSTVFVTRVTHVTIPPGMLFLLQRWAIAKSIRNVHAYVYANMKHTKADANSDDSTSDGTR